MINDYANKIKPVFMEYKQDLYIASIIFLVGLASFGLGRLSILWPQKMPLVIEKPDKAVAIRETTVVATQGKYVASKNGTAYHLPTCSGARNIKEENKIWFQTKEEAESGGYKPAANCEGL